MVRKEASELRSRVHCVGETYQPQTAWKDRSCRFDYLCFNTTSRDFVVFESAADRELARHFGQREFMHVSSSLHRLNESNSVALGGINLKWGKAGIPRLKWFPRIVPVPLRAATADDEQQQHLYVYEFPDTTVLIPFHSLNGANPGHLVWDDYLPIYTLLQMFRLLNKESDEDDESYNDHYDLLPMRFVLQDGEERGLWASCDLRPEKTEECRHMMQKFWPLIAGLDSPYTSFATNVDKALLIQSRSSKTGTTTDADAADGRSPSPDLVCAKTGLAGLGPLTDHGLTKAHGWEENDYKTVQNAGRGGALFQFRNFMLRNMNMDPDAVLTAASKPYRIVFSQKSSDIWIRNMDFERQIELVKENFPDALVENYIFKEMTLQEQLDVAVNTAVYITLCGGGAVTAMFLPAGASVILYYATDGGTYNGKMNHKPALLDWDLFNAMSHLRVHWMPRNTMKSSMEETALVMLIRHELELIESETFL